MAVNHGASKGSYLVQVGRSFLARVYACTQSSQPHRKIPCICMSVDVYSTSITGSHSGSSSIRRTIALLLNIIWHCLTDEAEQRSRISTCIVDGGVNTNQRSQISPFASKLSTLPSALLIVFLTSVNACVHMSKKRTTQLQLHEITAFIAALCSM